MIFSYFPCKREVRKEACVDKKAAYNKKTTYYYLLAEYHFRFLSLHNSQDSKWSAILSYQNFDPTFDSALLAQIKSSS